jgi:hypothetical protein
MEGNWEVGDLCLRCKVTPILDPKLPLCSKCREFLEAETARRVADRKNTTNKKRIRVNTKNLKHLFKPK